MRTPAAHRQPGAAHRVVSPPRPAGRSHPLRHPPTPSCQSVHFIIELAKGGELFERIISKGTFSEAEAARYFRQMVEVGGGGGAGLG